MNLKIVDLTQSIENTYYLRLEHEKTARGSIECAYHDYGLLKKHNCSVITLNFGFYLSKAEIMQEWVLFLDRLMAWGGLKPSKVSYLGYLFTKGDHGYFPHAHGLIYSTKDAVTGRTISSLSKSTLGKLQKYWKEHCLYSEWNSLNKPPFKIQRLRTSAKEMANYITGFFNMSATGQHWVELPNHNLGLLHEKIEEKRRKEAV